MITISRRRFLALSGGLLATGCSGSSEAGTIVPSPTSLGDPTRTTTTSTVPGIVTSVSSAELGPSGDNVLVLVELRGGNDAVNTLPPLAGAYRDLRPTIALPEADVVMSKHLGPHGLHPSLAPLIDLADAGRLATLAGIGFNEPDRSHFVSLDRWARADRMDDEIGWLGRWIDTLPDELPSLGATALGGTGEILLGIKGRGTVIDGVDAFAFPTLLSNRSIRLLGDVADDGPDDPMLAAAQRAFVDSVGATEEFDAIADAVRARVPEREPGDLGPASGAFTTGLAVAAEMILGDIGTRVVSISVNGFDTHSDQLAQHSDLLADLAQGLTRFWATLDDADTAGRVLVATTSEFGRRVAENASNGCDHGAAGVSFLMGDSIVPGVSGALDTANLLDGDLRPQIDPRVLMTACLDWLGADAERIIGQRHDDIPILDR
jgi:uncharacterized protein (DUF1501 family)